MGARVSDLILPLGGTYQLALDAATSRLIIVDTAGVEVASFPVVLAGAEIDVATVSGLLASDGDVEVSDPDHGVVLTASNGDRWRMTVSTGGAAVWTKIA